MGFFLLLFEWNVRLLFDKHRASTMLVIESDTAKNAEKAIGMTNSVMNLPLQNQISSLLRILVVRLHQMFQIRRQKLKHLNRNLHQQRKILKMLNVRRSVRFYHFQTVDYQLISRVHPRRKRLKVLQRTRRRRKKKLINSVTIFRQLKLTSSLLRILVVRLHQMFQIRRQKLKHLNRNLHQQRKILKMLNVRRSVRFYHFQTVDYQLISRVHPRRKRLKVLQRTRRRRKKKLINSVTIFRQLKLTSSLLRIRVVRLLLMFLTRR